MTTLTILGSSSGMPNAERACSGYLLQVGESLSLFDCGSGVVQSFLRRGFDPLMLDRIFISHTHSDHVSDLTLAIQMMHVLSTDRRLEIYLPDEFVEPFGNYLNAVYLIPERLRLSLVVNGFAEGEVYKQDFKVTAIANRHQTKLADDVARLGLPNKLQCFSLLVSVGGKTLLYTADLGSLDDIADHIPQADTILIETTHINLNELLTLAVASADKQFVLTHLGNREEVSALRSQVTQSGAANVVIAEDGMTIDL